MEMMELNCFEILWELKYYVRFALARYSQQCTVIQVSKSFISYAVLDNLIQCILYTNRIQTPTVPLTLHGL